MTKTNYQRPNVEEDLGTIHQIGFLFTNSESLQPLHFKDMVERGC